MHEKEHVIDVLINAKNAALNGDVILLKQLSNETIHSAAIYQDSDNVLVAVLVYSLGKLIERKDKYTGNFKKYFNFYIKSIDELISVINKGDEKVIQNKFNDISSVKGLSEELKRNVSDVFMKARINKASKIYEHGISMEATSKLLGVSIWELAEYTGQTDISDANYNKTIDIKKRVKTAMEFFG